MKWLKRHSFFLTAIVCWLTTSCAYYPRLTGVPLIKEKGDTRIEGGIGLLSQSLQASFSQGATDKIAYQLSASIDPYGPNNSSGLYAHGAIGLYKNILDHKVMEFYGGFAYGRSSAHKNANPGDVFGNYQVYFLQFNYGSIKKKKANFEYGVGIKSGLLNSKMTDAIYFFEPDYYLPNEPYPVYRLNGILFEPTVFLRLGGEKLKFWTALGASLYYQFNHTDKQLPASAPGFGLGVSYSFGGISKKQ